MKYWSGRGQTDSQAFDAHLRTQMLQRAEFLAAENGIDDFFGTPAKIAENATYVNQFQEPWNFSFRGVSWPNSRTKATVEPFTAALIGIETIEADGISGFELVLNAACRLPLLANSQDKDVRHNVPLTKKRLISTCTHFAIDLRYNYKLTGPKAKGIKRTANWELWGIRPEVGDDDILLAGKSFNPIRNPSPLGSYALFGPSREDVPSFALTMRERRQGRDIARAFDMQRIQDAVAVLVWAEPQVNG